MYLGTYLASISSLTSDWRGRDIHLRLSTCQPRKHDTSGFSGPDMESSASRLHDKEDLRNGADSNANAHAENLCLGKIATRKENQGTTHEARSIGRGHERGWGYRVHNPFLTAPTCCLGANVHGFNLEIRHWQQITPRPQPQRHLRAERQVSPDAVGHDMV